MGKHTTHSFCGLVTFVFLLYFAKVSRLSSVPRTIINAMHTDEKLCEMPKYLYENNITGICSSTKYPEEVTPEITYRKPFLCLAFYDTWYKVCNSEAFKKSFNKKLSLYSQQNNMFYSYIQTFLPEKNETDMFCEKIKGIKFSYEKLKPLLSLNINNTQVCSIICFDINANFNPLCAILAWSKSIDQPNFVHNGNQEVEQESKPVITLAKPQGSMEASSPQSASTTKSKPPISKSLGMVVDFGSDGRQNTINDNSLLLSQRKNVSTVTTIVHASDKLHEASKNSSVSHLPNGLLTGVVAAQVSNNRKAPNNSSASQPINGLTDVAPIQVSNNRKAPNNSSANQLINGLTDVAPIQVSNNQKAPNNSSASQPINGLTDVAPIQVSNNRKAPNNSSASQPINGLTDVAPIQVSNNQKAPNNPSTSQKKKISTDDESDSTKLKEEPKSPSEGAINNEVEESLKGVDEIKPSTISQNTQDDNSANQETWSREDEEKPYDTNDSPDQPIDAGDQNQNMPEPSEQRDIISPYHSMRSDEESHFFTYFTVVSLISIAAYIGYHNKQKILAIILEGRRSRNNRGRRRPSTANYRKLDCTLEEAVTSQCNANVTHVIY